MNFLNRVLPFLVFLAAIGALQPADAQVGSKLSTKSAGTDRWAVVFRGVDGKEKDISSATPDVLGFRMKGPALDGSVIVIEEDFEDGTQYGIYIDGKSGVSKRYELNDMLAIWKNLQSEHGSVLLFVNDSSDFDDVKNFVRAKDLFTTIDWSPTRVLTKSVCGFRDPQRILSRYSATSDKFKNYGDFLMASVGSLPVLTCKKAK